MKFIALLVPTLLLMACGGGGSSGSSTPGGPSASDTSASSVCGHEVGPKLLEGMVSKVHDGDTITVNGTSIRLDSIDAPELAQTYGALAQANLSRLLLGQTVRVAYTKTDQYGRVLGAVFTPNCRYANLEQVSQGSAWFYRAYQCEISAAARDQFAQAEASAKATRLGLWSQASPTPPWVYRNGTSPDIPNC